MVSGTRGFASACGVALALCSFNVTMAVGEHRQHGVHEHGAGRLNVAVEGEDVYLELGSPAANIVGFEHRPRNEEQKAAVRQGIKALERAERLFAFAPTARCRLVAAEVETDILGQHGEHAHEEKHGTEHGEHQKESTLTQEAHEREGDAHAAREQQAHSEFEASYRYACARPDALEYLDVKIFSVFPGTEEIEAQVITGTRQTSAQLTAGSARLRF